jgi:hypothetical protein
MFNHLTYHTLPEAIAFSLVIVAVVVIILAFMEVMTRIPVFTGLFRRKVKSIRPEKRPMRISYSDNYKVTLNSDSDPVIRRGME